MRGQALVDYAKSLDCIHCGLCLSSCPTYRLTGREASSPRGRIHLMRSVAEERIEADASYAEELDFCLVCRNCESVCPAGVRFGEMMEQARDGIEGSRPRFLPVRLARWIGFRVVLPKRWALRLAIGALSLGQATGVLGLIAPLLGRRGQALNQLPRVPRRSERGPLPSLVPADRRALPSDESPRVAVLFEGCVMPELYGRVNRACAATLTKLGEDVRCPVDRAPCCGALHAHNGDLEGSRDQARRVIDSYGVHHPEAPIVVNSAGCGAHMKDFGRLLEDDPAYAGRARSFADRVVDFSEHAAPRLEGKRAFAGTVGAAGTRGAAPKVTWDDPCHLCHGQGIRKEPRDLLARLDGIETVPLERSESCCGSAGIYSVLRPGDSQAVFAEKLEAFRRSGADVLVTANPGCQLQWESGLRSAGIPARVMHIGELLGDAEFEDESGRRG